VRGPETRGSPADAARRGALGAPPPWA